MNMLKAFLAGFLSTLTFHQGILALLYAAGLAPFQPYSMRPTFPLGVPQVLSLAFWGGLWGIVLWLAVRALRAWRYWVFSTALGAVAPTIVALFLVFPLKGQPVAGGWRPSIILGALILNGAWGVGVALICRLLGAADSRARGSA